MINVSALVFLLLVITGVILLQIFLSKAESKWFGLILPVISGLFSVLAVLGLAFYGGLSKVQFIIQIIVVFILYNIPTLILLAIYFTCREKLKRKKGIDKMNIQDLE